MSIILDNPQKIRKAKLLIYTLSVVIPLAVALLFKLKIPNVDFSILPPIYAGINALTALLLILALVAIKGNKMILHRKLIRICLLLSVSFLLLYVAYHITSDTTKYLGAYSNIYYPLLFAHILLSIAVIPLVLFSYLHAWQGNFVKHKKWVRFSFPIWLFVAVSGVVVYFMISPYYVH